MDYRGIDAEIRIQVIKNLDYLQRQEKDKPDQALQILELVSQKIKNQVFENFYGKILNKQLLFKLNFSQKFLKNLSQIMNERILSPGEIIYNQGEKDHKIYFVIKGSLQLRMEIPSANKIQNLQNFKVARKRARERERIKM